MALPDFYDLLEPLVVPIGGKGYTLEPIPTDVGVELKRAAEGKPSARMKKMTQGDMYRMVIGPAYDEMVADGVRDDAQEQAYITAIAEFRSGRQAAERVWTAGMDPEVRAALRAAAQEAEKNLSPVSPRSPSTAKASKTPTAVSSSTTSRPATPRPARKAAAKPSLGSRSLSSPTS